MKTTKCMGKFFLVIMFISFSISNTTGQGSYINDLDLNKVKQKLNNNKKLPGLEKQIQEDAAMSHLLTSRQNNNCSSEFVYVIRLIKNNKLITTYYCESEKIQHTADFNKLKEYYSGATVKTEKIKNNKYKSNSNKSGNNQDVHSNSGTNTMQENNNSSPPINVNVFETLPSAREQNKIISSQNTPPEINLNKLSAHITKNQPNKGWLEPGMAPTLRKTGTVIDEISVAHPHRHSFPQNAKIQIDKDNEIKPERPYIELTAETAKSLIQLTAKTGTGILAGLTINIWKENIKAVMAYHNGEQVPSTKEIFYNAFWNNGKVPAEILGGVVSDGLMKGGAKFLMHNAENLGVRPYYAGKQALKTFKMANTIETGIDIGSGWGTQFGKDWAKSQYNKEK